MTASRGACSQCGLANGSDTVGRIPRSLAAARWNSPDSVWRIREGLALARPEPEVLALEIADELEATEKAFAGKLDEASKVIESIARPNSSSTRSAVNARNLSASST